MMPAHGYTFTKPELEPSKPEAPNEEEEEEEEEEDDDDDDEYAEDGPLLPPPPPPPPPVPAPRTSCLSWCARSRSPREAKSAASEPRAKSSGGLRLSCIETISCRRWSSCDLSLTLYMRFVRLKLLRKMRVCATVQAAGRGAACATRPPTSASAAAPSGVAAAASAVPRAGS